MTKPRPRRKAAGVKNYLDTIIEAILEDPVEPPAPSVAKSKKRASSSKSTSPGCATPATGKVPYNWQPPPSPDEVFSHKLNLKDAHVNSKLQILTCPEQPPVDQRHASDLKDVANLLQQHTATKAAPRRKKETLFHVKKGDYIYMVSEPPGEPYYIGRVMGFTRKGKQEQRPEIEDASFFVFQIQWFYRPRDISKNTTDSRLLFASMHSDTCPLSSFRGLVTVKHKLEIETDYRQPKEGTPQMTALEYYSSHPNCFYFDKLFDRYMIKFYDIIKTSSLLAYIDNTANNSRNYILALNKRFEFVFMEAARTKQFVLNFDSTSSSHCDICAEWCSASTSVTCAGCEKHFHMLCLDPPLLKKPSRGFSWSCAVCTKKHEMEYHSKKILMLSHDNKSSNEQEISEADSVPEDSSEDEARITETPLPKYEVVALDFLNNDAHESVESRRLKEEWSMRYLGTHTRLEDAVDLDDRSPYPRAATSLGARFQASNIPEYEDHPIVYYDVERKDDGGKLKKGPGGRKIVKKKAVEEETAKLPVPEEFADVSPKEYPQWLQPRPKGYVERGVDDGAGDTCTLMWKPLEKDNEDGFVRLEQYMSSCEPKAVSLGILPKSPNFVDAILKFYMECDGDAEKALELVSQLTRKLLKEPTLNKEEVKRFEAGVKKNGSELYPTFKEVKTQPCAMVVRYYYLWKKSKRGKLIWGNYPGRKKKSQATVKEEKQPEIKLAAVDDYADSDDDSSYENDKIIQKKKLFRCKHCRSYLSPQWFKITGYDGNTKYEDDADDVDPNTVTALCFRCAKLWRRYAVYWEDPNEVERKNTRGIGGYRKKVESELVNDSARIIRQAESEGGGGLSYEPNKDVECSVVQFEPEKPFKTDIVVAASNFFTRTELPSPKPPKAPAKAQPVKTSPRTTKAKTTPKASRPTSRQASISKTELKLETKSEESQPKKRKTSTENGTARTKPKVENEEIVKAPRKRAPPKVKQEKDTEANGVAPSNGTTKRKRKPAEPKKTKEPTQGVEEARPSAAKPGTGAKRQKRSGSSEVALLNPVFNPDYRGDLPKLASVAKIDKKLFPQLNRQVLEEIVNNYKIRQLTDMKLLVLSLQTPTHAKIELPFAVNERNCCICVEHDDKEESLMEMLICSNCGVNVHASCAGITISGKQKPVKQWLCEPCTNDLSPNYSTLHSCSLCLANELNNELSILGSPIARPDYLSPILESGKWCHLICALYSYRQTVFRNVLVPAFVPKEILNATSTRGFGSAIESVSNVFLENYSTRCGICSSLSGALITCDLCGEDGEHYHVTCAQDTPNFKLGFKIVPQKVSKANTNTYVGDQVGKLEPILVCPQHTQRGAVYSIRKLGRRTPSGETKPLIQLFIEDIARSTNVKLSGPQFRAHNYINMIENFTRAEERITRHKMPEKTKKETQVCEVCAITSSPKWWPSPASSVRCQNCYHREDPRADFGISEGDLLAQELNEPLSGHNYGIGDPNDLISLVYVPAEKRAHIERSKITIGDILT